MRAPARPISTLFVQSQDFFGADTELHAQLMRYLDHGSTRVHVAVTTSPSAPGNTDVGSVISSIPGITVVPTDFGARRTGTLVGKANRTAALARAALRLARYVRRERIDVVHGTEKPRDALTVVAVGKLTGARSVIHAHVSYGDWMSRGVKWALRHADAVIAVSDFTRRSLVDAGVEPGRVYEVLNALDTRSGRWDRGDRARVRDELGYDDDDVVFGVVSRLFSWKGHLDLLEAFAAVAATTPKLELLVVGEDDPRGNPADGTFSEVIRRRAAELGIDDCVRLTGFRTDVPDVMAAIDAYTMPSWEEPFGMVYLEAMALRRPTVAWDLGGPAEIILDGVTGYLVPPKDLVALTDALRGLACDAERRRRFGDAGRARVLAHFSCDRMAREVRDVYESVLARRDRVSGPARRR